MITRLLDFFKKAIKRRRIKSVLSGDEVMLHVGCGLDYKFGYINIDIDSSVNPDLVMSIEDFSLFPDVSVVNIESYHFFEHLSYTQAVTAIENWYRILKPGGKIILEMPNLDVCRKEIGCHFNDAGVDLAMVGIYGYPPDVDRFGVGLMHKWGWSPNTLKDLLEEKKFVNVQESSVQQTNREASKFGRDMNLIAEKPFFNIFFKNSLLINKDYKFIYCPIPKVACTSFKRLLLEIDGVLYEDKIDRQFHELVRDKFSLENYADSVKKQYLENEKYFKFAFVRNPWDRLVSAFIDKFIRPKNLEDFAIEFSLRAVGERGSGDRNINFQDFVRHIVKQKPQFLNDHWMPQYMFLGDVEYDFIGKIESIQKNYQYLQEELNFQCELPVENRVEKRSLLVDGGEFHVESIWLKSGELLKQLDLYPRYTAWYNDELKCLVEQYYKVDIDRFGYSFG